MRILVTGATGFMGVSLTAALKQRGHEVDGIGSHNCDLTQSDSLQHISKERFDQIFHLAAWTQAGDFCLRYPGDQWVINQKINIHVLDWWLKKQPQAKLICMGTSCAYDPDLELSEENYLAGTPIESLFTYAMTKRMLYVGLRSLSKQFGLKYLCLVPSTLYGPSYHTDGRQMHFIFDLIRKILRGRIYNEPVVLWGNGYQKRELVFIDDFINLTLRVNEIAQNDLINIGAGVEFTIRDFAEIICHYVGYNPAQIQYDTSRYVGATSKCLDIRKLKSLVPDLEVVKLQDGLQKTISWFESSKAYDLEHKI